MMVETRARSLPPPPRLHPALEPPAHHPHEGNLIAMAWVHVRLKFEHEPGEVIIHGLNLPRARLSPPGTHRVPQKRVLLLGWRGSFITWVHSFNFEDGFVNKGDLTEKKRLREKRRKRGGAVWKKAWSVVVFFSGGEREFNAADEVDEPCFSFSNVVRMGHLGRPFTPPKRAGRQSCSYPSRKTRG